MFIEFFALSRLTFFICGQVNVVEERQPNAAAQQSNKSQDFTFVTQNVDGLHTAAGSEDVLELHGSIWQARCLDCQTRRDLREVPADERPPVCLACGDLMRPNIVLFGEMLPPEVFEAAERQAERCDICFIIGTSALVYPAASLPDTARQNGAFIVEINPETTAFSARARVSLRGIAGEILPQVFV